MLAGELGMAGARPLVLERQPEIRDIPKAGGLSGQILELLRYEASSSDSRQPAPLPAGVPAGERVPVGRDARGLHPTRRSPDEALPLPQPLLERVLDERARERGAEIRRSHQVVGLRQDDDTVTAEVRGSDGQDRVTARYLVGCDGGSGRVRDMAGIPFPGITYPEVQRLAR
jgi:2-polyprenyl-6-methoxyphenol hydroxylase-like FAD-dependent oxidoreductase